MPQLSIVIVAACEQFALVRYQSKALATVRRRKLSDLDVFERFNFLWLRYPKYTTMLRQNEETLRFIVPVAKLPTAIEPYCEHLPSPCKHGNVLISRCNLTNVKFVEEFDLRRCISLICVT
jgi:hypothetical protein